MLKITQTPDGGEGVLLKLEGDLREPWLAELASLCAPTTRVLRLDLSALRYADAAGVQFLLGCLDRGVAIASCSGFIAELLRQENRP
jgi:anti-anti-sigma regulatory factor